MRWLTPNCPDALRESSPAKGELITRVAADLTKREVLNSVITSPGSTRASISQETGLAASTVGHVIASLIADGRITEYKQRKGPGSGSGRPAKVLMAVRTPHKRAATASINFGRSHLVVALGDESGRLGAYRRIDFDVAAHPHQALDLATDALATLRRTMDVGRPTVVVCGLPAPVDARTGTISSPRLLPGWTGIRPSDELRRRLDATVRTEAGTLLGALGELRAGAGRAHRDFLYINASCCVGAGLVLNGDIYRGATGLAGRFGQPHLTGHSEECLTGGSEESACGGKGRIEAGIGGNSGSIAMDELPVSAPSHEDDCEPLTATARASVRRQVGSALGAAVAGICSLLNPAVMIVGSPLVVPGGEFLDGLRTAVRHHSPPPIWGALEIIPADLGDPFGVDRWASTGS